MKKILTSLLSLGSAVAVYGTTFTVTVLPGTATNLYTGPCLVKQVVLSSIDTTNSTAYLFDSTAYTNLAYVLPAYSNTVSYATNYINTWTNYWGAVTITTNLALIDATNTLVAASTNAYPIKFSGSVTAGTSYKVDQVYVPYIMGLQATNPATSGKVVFTVTIQ